MLSFDFVFVGFSMIPTLYPCILYKKLPEGGIFFNSYVAQVSLKLIV